MTCGLVSSAAYPRTPKNSLGRHFVDSPIVLASLATAGYAAWYLMLCSAFPFGPCRRCNGEAKHRNPFGGNSFRLCRKCAGTGRRVRLGRRVWEYFRSEHRRGQIPGDPRPSRHR